MRQDTNTYYSSEKNILKVNHSTKKQKKYLETKKRMLDTNPEACSLIFYKSNKSIWQITAQGSIWTGGKIRSILEKILE